jgi:hypothetical protein
MAVDEGELARMTHELEVMLRAFNDRPDRCCHRSCLRCPERTWQLGDPFSAACD